MKVSLKGMAFRSFDLTDMIESWPPHTGRMSIQASTVTCQTRSLVDVNAIRAATQLPKICD